MTLSFLTDSKRDTAVILDRRIRLKYLDLNRCEPILRLLLLSFGGSGSNSRRHAVNQWQFKMQILANFFSACGAVFLEISFFSIVVKSRSCPVLLWPTDCCLRFDDCVRLPLSVTQNSIGRTCTSNIHRLSSRRFPTASRLSPRPNCRRHVFCIEAAKWPNGRTQ